MINTREYTQFNLAILGYKEFCLYLLQVCDLYY
nr:MAG TPA: hypothetical protein [Caudoviricetes sp.]DAZ22069.1 MAG TPA: hypothetical protein [Caudoviricetes sp.]